MHCNAWQVWHGMHVSRYASAWHGMAWHGAARHGTLQLGTAAGKTHAAEDCINALRHFKHGQKVHDGRTCAGSRRGACPALPAGKRPPAAAAHSDVAAVAPLAAPAPAWQTVPASGAPCQVGKLMGGATSCRGWEWCVDITPKTTWHAMLAALAATSHPCLLAISCPILSVPAMPAGVVICKAHCSAATAGRAAASSRAGSRRRRRPRMTPRSHTIMSASPMARGKSKLSCTGTGVVRVSPAGSE